MRVAVKIGAIIGLLSIAACENAPNAEKQVARLIEAPLEQQIRSKSVNEYEIYLRCMAVQRVFVDSIGAFDLAEPLPDKEATLITLAAYSDFKTLAEQPKFHPPNFAEAGRKRRVKEGSEAFTMLYKQIADANGVQVSITGQAPQLLTNDRLYCATVLSRLSQTLAQLESGS